MKTRRALRIKTIDTDTILEISKFATPHVEKEFVHLDKLPDGTWRLLFNVEGLQVPDILSFEFVREDDE